MLYWVTYRKKNVFFPLFSNSKKELSVNFRDFKIEGLINIVPAWIYTRSISENTLHLNHF